jgi:long-chain fatty acid transport protein
MRYGLSIGICAGTIAGLLSVLSTTAFAAGFAILEQSVKGLGHAFAGRAAIAEDASTIFFNPAGLTRLPGMRLEAAANIIIPSAKFDNEGSALNAAFTGGMPTAGTLMGGDGGDAGEVGLIPNLYYAHQITQRLYAGLGINAPFGLTNDYREGWVGRYHALKSELLTINVNPTLAVKLNPTISVGAGVNIQYIKARLTNAIDQSGVCLGLAAGSRVPEALCASAGLVSPGNPATDAEIDLDDATDTSVGYNIGVLLTPVESTRFGVHYRSEIRHELEAKATFNRVNAVFSEATGLLVNQDAKAKVTLPESLSMSVYHQINAQWGVMADITWTRWSRFDELVIEFEGTQPTQVQPQNWDDSFMYSVGVRYTPNDRWTLRVGLAYDETPIPSAEDRNPRIPGNDRFWMALGASYQVADKISIDMGYAHLFIEDIEINNTEVSTGHVLTGRYEAAVNIFSAQVSYHF